MYVLCLSITTRINVHFWRSVNSGQLLHFMAVNMGAFKMLICISVICKSSRSRTVLHRVFLCYITAPPSVIITRIPLFTITVVISFVFVCPIRKRQCWSGFRGTNWSRFAVIRTYRNQEGKSYCWQFAVTINSWAQLLNTSCQSLKRLYVLLFDLGSYHVHVLLVDSFGKVEARKEVNKGRTAAFEGFFHQCCFTLMELSSSANAERRICGL